MPCDGRRRPWLAAILVVVAVHGASAASMRPATAGPGDRPSIRRLAGKCRLEVEAHTYIAGDCPIAVNRLPDGGSTGVTISKGAYFAEVDTSQDGKAEGFWNGPFAESHADAPLGRLIKSGDCWLNKKVEICASGRVRRMIGKCLLAVGGRTFVSGDCPIETSKPFGSFYINDRCGAASGYFAHVSSDGGSSGSGSWTGNPPGPTADVDLGKLRRSGACWSNASAKICAYQGKAITGGCEPNADALPAGPDDSDKRSSFFEPAGRCSLIVRSRTYIDGACHVESEANVLVVTGTATAAGFDAQLRAEDGRVAGAWNGAFGEKGFRVDLGRLARDGDCWKGDASTICVTYPSVALDCKGNSCLWRLDRHARPQGDSR